MKLELTENWTHSSDMDNMVILPAVLVVLHVFLLTTDSQSVSQFTINGTQYGHCSCQKYGEVGGIEFLNCTFQAIGSVERMGGRWWWSLAEVEHIDDTETCSEVGDTDTIEISNTLLSGNNLCNTTIRERLRFILTGREASINICEVYDRHYLVDIDGTCLYDSYYDCQSDTTVAYSYNSVTSLTNKLYERTRNYDDTTSVLTTQVADGATLAKKDKIAAAVSAVVALMVFIIAIILVLFCCRRRKTSNAKGGSLSPTDLVHNSAYISVETAPANPGLPVYAKPNKGNRQPNATGDDGGYEKAPAVRPPDSGYEDATLSPIPRFSGNYESDPPATPPRPRSHHMARTSTPADGYEGANFKTPRGDSADGYEEATLPGGTGDNFKTPNPGYSTGYEDNFVTPATGLTSSSSGYEDNFVTPKGGVSDGYEDNFVTPQTGPKDSVKYDHLKRKLDLDDDTGSGAGNLDVKEADGYGQIRKQSELVDAEEYQHLSHDKAPSNVEDGYGMLKKK